MPPEPTEKVFQAVNKQARTGLPPLLGSLSRRRSYPVRLLRRIVPDVTPHAFQAEAIEIVNTPTSPIGRAISWTIMTACLAALIWSFVGKLDIVIAARGRVIPSEKTSTVQAPEAALVSQIHTRDGATVAAGELLISLNPTEALADRERLRLDLAESRLTQAHLRALIAAPEDPERAAALFAPPEHSAPDAAARHQNQLVSLVSENRAKLLSLQAEREQRLAEAAGSRADLERINTQLPLMREQIEAKRHLASTGIMARLPLLDAEQTLAGSEAEAKVLTSRLAGTEAAIQKIGHDIEQLRAETQRTAFAQLADAELRAEATQQELIKAEHRARTLAITAPVAGYVQQLSVNTLGGVVSAGQPLLVIVPEGARLEVEARIDNKDIGDVRVGQGVEVKIDAFDFTKYGLIDGTILTLSRDAVPPAEAVPGTPMAQQMMEPVYLARIALNRESLGSDPYPLKLTPGMGATAEVKTGRRRVIDYLLSPVMEHAHDGLREK